jgi:aspartate racemase
LGRQLSSARVSVRLRNVCGPGESPVPFVFCINSIRIQMKTIGIIGGLSPASTMKYYQWLNDGMREQLGGHHSAKIILWSVDFAEFCALKEKGDWETQSILLCHAAKQLEAAGADFIVLATNTMHKIADDIIASTSLPFLHIADATASKVLDQRIETIAFLGTKYSMELDFYTGRLRDRGLKVMVPDANDRKIVNDIIYDELTKGIVLDESRAEYIRVISKLRDEGAQGVILGCTEITMIVDPQDSPVPVFDTTRIHVDEARRFALASKT